MNITYLGRSYHVTKSGNLIMMLVALDTLHVLACREGDVR